MPENDWIIAKGGRTPAYVNMANVNVVAAFRANIYRNSFGSEFNVPVDDPDQPEDEFLRSELVVEMYMSNGNTEIFHGEQAQSIVNYLDRVAGFY
jgi:hypothetical protein